MSKESTFTVPYYVENDVRNGILFSDFKTKYSNLYGDSFNILDFIKLREQILLTKVDNFRETMISDTERQKLDLRDAIRNCEKSLEIILAVHAENSQRLKTYEAEYIKYLRDKEIYDTKMREINDFCSRESRRRVNLNSDQDGQCYKHTNDYGKFVIADRRCVRDVLGVCLDYADICGYENQDQVRNQCIFIESSKLTVPVEPKRPTEIQMPQVTCQICPNIVEIAGAGNIIAETSINQASNCLIQQKQVLQRMGESTDILPEILPEDSFIDELIENIDDYKYYIIAVVVLLLILIL